MERMLVLIGMSAGGWTGYALGAPFPLVVSLFLSLVGTAAGLYAARRVAASWD